MDNKEILNLTVLAGEILLHNGAEIFRVQETMTKIAQSYGAEDFQVYVISNGIFTSISEGGRDYSTQIRYIPLSPVHLGRVAAVNQLSREIAQGKYTIAQAEQKLKEIGKIPYMKNSAQVFAAGLGSGCFCFLFGGSVYDSIISFFSGALLYLFVTAAERFKLSKIMTNLLGSALVAICGLTFFHLGLGENFDKIIIGSIIPLVPGVPLTTAVRDFFNGDYVAGTIHLIDALLIAFCIAIGVGVVLKLFSPLL